MKPVPDAPPLPPAEVDRLEAGEACRRQVARLDHERVVARQAEPPQGHDGGPGLDVEGDRDCLVGQLQAQAEHARPRLEAVSLDLAAERVEPADRVLEATLGDVRPEAAPDLDQALGEELAEGLPDGGPADLVAVHQLDLGRKLGARHEVARPDPIADVRLDLAVERQPGRGNGAHLALTLRSSGVHLALIP